MRVKVNKTYYDLSENDFVAHGGEGRVYAVKRTAFKIYDDANKVIPAGKIKELSKLAHRDIIKPKALIEVQDSSGDYLVIGYSMRYIKTTYALCELFPKAFKNRKNVSDKKCLSLIAQMQETVSHIHSKKILIVDLNEMNFMVNSRFDKVYFIDVDSYQTPSYPATAIMDNIKDRHSKTFSELTDWFSWGIVTFNLLVGIHPYKGKHPHVKTMDERMQKNISVFDPNVRVPKTCNSLNAIPGNLRQWYKAVFQDGLREAPPIDYLGTHSIMPISEAKCSYSKCVAYVVTEEKEAQWDIHDYYKFKNTECLINNAERYNLYFKGRYLSAKFNVLGVYGSTLIAGSIVDDKLELYNISKMRSIKHIEVQADNIISIDGRIYIQCANNIMEVCFQGKEYDPMVSLRKVGNALPHATKAYPGVMLQNMLGTCYASIFPKEGECYQYHLPSLDKCTIVDAKYSNEVLMVVITKKGKYDRFIFHLKKGKVIEEREINDVDHSGLNFVVLNNGICVSMTEQEKVEVFYKDKLTSIKVIEDPMIGSGIRLFTDGSKVFFADKKKLYHLSVKE